MVSPVFIDNLIKNLPANQASPTVKINNSGIVIKIPKPLNHHLTLTSLTFHFLGSFLYPTILVRLME
jgi:hypothetical protein